MKIDRKSEAWKSAPWHVKVSAYGLKTVDGIRLWKNLSFLVGLAGLLVGAVTVAIEMDLGRFQHIPFYLGNLGLAACMYWFALDWFRDHEDAVKSDN